MRPGYSVTAERSGSEAGHDWVTEVWVRPGHVPIRAKRVCGNCHTRPYDLHTPGNLLEFVPCDRPVKGGTISRQHEEVG